MSTDDAEDRPLAVLLVCTGNICRSALAERLGQAYLADVLGSDAVRLASAGTRAVVGSAMHPDSALVLEGLGGTAGDFRARQLMDGMITEADLVLTMTRAHRQDVLHRVPRALHRTFTLTEAAALLRLLPVPAPEPCARGRRLVADLATARPQRHSGEDDDIQDPIGQPLEVHAEVGQVIADALLPLLLRVAGAAPPG